MANIINGINCDSGSSTAPTKKMKVTDGYYLNGSGTTTANSNYEYTDYLPLSKSTSITFYGGYEATVGGSACLVEYNSSKTPIQYWSAQSSSRTVTLSGGTNTAYVRMTILKSAKTSVSLFDNTNGYTVLSGAKLPKYYLE